MQVKWVSPEEVPSEGRRGSTYYKALADKLRKNPGNWAIWTEHCDNARYYEWRKRFPELEFRRKQIQTDAKSARYQVFARYVAD